MSTTPQLRQHPLLKQTRFFFTMLDIKDFNSVFHFDSKFSFSHNAQVQIEQHRRALNGHLFFDRLLHTLRIESTINSSSTLASQGSPITKQLQTAKPYPPKTHKELRELHDTIVKNDNIADHHKYSLLYYILLDTHAHAARSSSARRNSSTVQPQPAEDLARAVFLPSKYEMAIQGLWNLDQLSFKPALDYLTQPSLLPTFPLETLEALVRNEQWELAMGYWHTVAETKGFGIVGEEGELLLKSYFRILCDASVSAAYEFLKSQPTRFQRPLLEQLIASALGLPSTGGNHAGEARAGRCVELVDLPLTVDEEELLEQYLLKGEGRNLPGAKETLGMRLIVMGRVKEAREIMRDVTDGGKDKAGLNWQSVMEGLTRGMGERSRIVPLWNDV